MSRYPFELAWGSSKKSTSCELSVRRHLKHLVNSNPPRCVRVDAEISTKPIESSNPKIILIYLDIVLKSPACLSNVYPTRFLREREMRLVSRSLLVASAVFAVSSVTLAADVHVTVNFDDQPGGIPPVETAGTFNPYVTFTTNSGSAMLIFGGAGVVGTSPPHNLTAALTPTSALFNEPITATFTNPVNDLAFLIAADNDAGDIADVIVTSASGTNTIDVTGNANIADPIPVDLTHLNDVTSVTINNITDEFGLSYDDFNFMAPEIVVPEPATLSLIGAIGLLAIRRTRN